MSYEMCGMCQVLFKSRKGYGGRTLCEPCLKAWPGEIEITRKIATKRRLAKQEAEQEAEV